MKRRGGMWIVMDDPRSILLTLRLRPVLCTDGRSRSLGGEREREREMSSKPVSESLSRGQNKN